MICPNCGKELPAGARVCSGCAAVQHVYRRTRTETDIPSMQVPKVTRRVKPNTKETSGTPTGVRRESPQRDQISDMPLGLRKQGNRDHTRVVRRSETKVKRKVDGKPRDPHPAIYTKSHKRLLYALVGALGLFFFMGTFSAYVLFGTEYGQRMMAEWGWSQAGNDAYVTLGKDLLAQGYTNRAMEKLQYAIDREPNNVDALIYMAEAYMSTGHIDEAEEIYEALIDHIAPNHPSAYRNLINIYQQKGYHGEAIQLMKQAAEKTTGTSEFDIMIRTYTPVNPTFSHNEGRYNEEIDVTITVPAGETVYYSTDGTDPSESGLVYKAGTKIHVAEGKMTIKAVGFTEKGVSSEQITANYTVIIPTPAAPKANYQSGKYKKAPKVSLRPGSEDAKENKRIVAIYYTLDGRQATTESTLYEEPIQLPLGKSTLRAIAVADNGKISYEMRVTYEVEGNLKKRFSQSNDTFKNLTLFKTSYQAFTRAYGQPDKNELLPEDQWYQSGMESSEATYSWGVARFVKKTATGSPVLYYLDTTSSSMTGPRSTKIGMSSVDIMSKFMDQQQPALDDAGNRLLYNHNSANVSFGTYRREQDGQYCIHYYDPVDEKNSAFVELTYYLNAKGDAERILWRRYVNMSGS